MIRRPYLLAMALVGLVSSVIVGSIVGGHMLYIGYQHNPQGEFFDPQTGAIDYPYSALLFFSWFIPVAGPLLLVLCLLPLVMRWALLRIDRRGSVRAVVDQ